MINPLNEGDIFSVFVGETQYFIRLLVDISSMITSDDDPLLFLEGGWLISISSNKPFDKYLSKGSYFVGDLNEQFELVDNKPILKEEVIYPVHTVLTFLDSGAEVLKVYQGKDLVKTIEKNQPAFELLKDRFQLSRLQFSLMLQERYWDNLEKLESKQNLLLDKQACQLAGIR